MPVVKYRTIHARGTEEAYNSIYGLFWHLAPFALDLKAINVIGQPEMGFQIELSEALPPEQLPHLELEFLG